jgi:hypothetical protein
MPIEEFLSTHFCLGGDSPNPRLVLLFLNFMFEASSHYYSRNPDRVEIEANDANEYELILREHLQAGYLKLQDTARKTIAQLDREWRPYVERLYEKLRNPGSCDHISVEQIKKYIEWQSSDEELSRFLAFFTHVGLFIQENPSASMPNRTYTLPTVLKRCGA